MLPVVDMSSFKTTMCIGSFHIGLFLLSICLSHTSLEDGMKLKVSRDVCCVICQLVLLF